MAPAELDSRQVKQVHAIQIVVYEELQQEGDVGLVGLVNLVHHCSALQQLTHPTTGGRANAYLLSPMSLYEWDMGKQDRKQLCIKKMDWCGGVVPFQVWIKRWSMLREVQFK